MTAFARLTSALAKRTLRDPAAVFFMLAFAPFYAVVMGLIFGNDPRPEFGGVGYVDANLVGLSAIVVAIAGLVLVPIDLVGQRETGALRRFRATPLRPIAYVAADLLVRWVIALVGIGLMIGVGVLGFGARPEGSLAGVLIMAALGTLVFLALGYALTAVVPTLGVAQLIGNVLVYPLIILSGATVPLALLPAGVQAAAQASPLTQLVVGLQGAWAGTPAWTPVVALTGVLAAATLVAARYFRWE